MVTLEQVEKLRNHTGATYEDAKKALEETNGDMLEAIIYLEKKGKIRNSQVKGYYHSAGDRGYNKDSEGYYGDGFYNSQQANSFGKSVKGFIRWVGKIVHKGNINCLKVVKDNEKILTVPLTALVLLLILAFWVVLPVMIIGLIFGYRYRFEGPDVDSEQVNKAMDSVANAAHNFKEDIKKDLNKEFNKEFDNDPNK